MKLSSSIVTKFPTWLANRRRTFTIFAYNEHITHWPLRRIRTEYLRWILGFCGRDVTILMHNYLMNPHQIFIGDRTVIHQHCILDGRVAELHIGNDVDIGTPAIFGHYNIIRTSALTTPQKLASYGMSICLDS